jgi:flagellar FliL protein
MATAPKTAKAAPKVVPIEEGVPAAAPVPRKSKKKLFLFVTLLLLMLGGGGAWFLLAAEVDPDAPVAVEPAKPPVYLPMEQFTVNLQPEIGDQYLQIAFTLQVADQAQVEQIKLYMPLVRSRLLMLLSSKKPSELSSAGGKQQLQEEIVATLREPFAQNMAPTGVNGVFFTAFVIQ